jgi:hypothetical protein
MPLDCAEGIGKGNDAGEFTRNRRGENPLCRYARNYARTQFRTLAFLSLGLLVACLMQRKLVCGIFQMWLVGFPVDVRPISFCL